MKRIWYMHGHGKIEARSLTTIRAGDYLFFRSQKLLGSCLCQGSCRAPSLISLRTHIHLLLAAPALPLHNTTLKLFLHLFQLLRYPTLQFVIFVNFGFWMWSVGWGKVVVVVIFPSLALFVYLAISFSHQLHIDRCRHSTSFPYPRASLSH